MININARWNVAANIYITSNCLTINRAMNHYLTRMTTFIKAQEIRWLTLITNIEISCKYYRISYYLKSNLPKNLVIYVKKCV